MVLKPKGAFLEFAVDSDAFGFLDLGTISIIKACDAKFFEDMVFKDKTYHSKIYQRMW